MWLSNRSVGQRLALGFGLVTLMVAGLLGSYIVGEQQQDEAARLLTQQIMPKADVAHDLEAAYLYEALGARTYLLSGDQLFLTDYDRGRTQSAQAMARLAQFPESSQEQGLLNDLQAMEAQFVRAADHGIALRQQGDVAGSQQVIVDQMWPARSEMMTRAEAYVALQSQLRDQARANMDQVRANTTRATGGAAAGVLLLSAIIAYLTARSVRNPARKLVLASRALESGDFSRAIGLAPSPGDAASSGQSGNEMRELQRSFASMARGLLHRDQRLAARGSLSSVLAASVDLDKLSSEAVREIAQYTGAEFGLFYLYDSEGEFLVSAGSYAFQGGPSVVKMEEGIPGEAAASRRTVLVRDIPSDTPFLVRFGVDQAPPRSILAVPVVCAQDQLVGTLLFGSLRDFSKDAVDFVEVSAKQIGVSLQNAIVHRRIAKLAQELQEKNEVMTAQNEELQAQSDELQSQNEELQLQSEEIQGQTEELATQNAELALQAERISRLQEVAGRLSENLSLEEVLYQIVHASSELLRSSISSVLLLDPQRDGFVIVASEGLDPRQKNRVVLPQHNSLAGRVLAEGRTLFIEDVSQTPDVRFPMLAGSEALGSIIVSPLVAAGEDLGVVEVYFTAPRAFSTDDVDLITALASAAAAAVRNARLFTETQQQRQLLASILETIPQAVQVVDRAGHLVVANPTARVVFGIEDGQKALNGLLPAGGPDAASMDLPVMWQPTARALRGETILGQEVSLADPDNGSSGYAEVSAVPILDDNGAVLHVVTVASDITRLKELDRMKDEFLSVASHELKSPLTSLKGFAQLLQDRMSNMPGGEAHLKPLQIIDSQTDKVVQLVNRLLDVSRIQMGRLDVRPEMIDLAELVGQQVQQAALRTSKHVMVLDADGPVQGEWDRGYIEQVVANLLDNAIRYSPDGGDVVVKLRCADEAVRLAVIDSGIGISPDALPNLFKRYYRSSAARRTSAEGLGVGLYITQEIVAAHGGRIWAENRVDGGSIFTIELPLRSHAAATMHREEALA